MGEMLIKYIGVKPSEIVYFQFLIEGYESVGTLTTLDPKKGLLRFAVPGERRAEAEEILRWVGREVAFEEVAIETTEK